MQFQMCIDKKSGQLKNSRNVSATHSSDADVASVIRLSSADVVSVILLNNHCKAIMSVITITTSVASPTMAFIQWGSLYQGSFSDL